MLLSVASLLDWMAMDCHADRPALFAAIARLDGVTSRSILTRRDRSFPFVVGHLRGIDWNSRAVVASIVTALCFVFHRHGLGVLFGLIVGAAIGAAV